MNYLSLICILKLEQILMSFSFLKQKILKSPGDKHKHKHTALLHFHVGAFSTCGKVLHPAQKHSLCIKLTIKATPIKSIHRNPIAPEHASKTVLIMIMPWEIEVYIWNLNSCSESYRFYPITNSVSVNIP